MGVDAARPGKYRRDFWHNAALISVAFFRATA
jgi:hypothetical protein